MTETLCKADESKLAYRVGWQVPNDTLSCYGPDGMDSLVATVVMRSWNIVITEIARLIQRIPGCEACDSLNVLQHCTASSHWEPSMRNVLYSSASSLAPASFTRHHRRAPCIGA